MQTGVLEPDPKILPPSFAAVSISDVKNQIAFVEVSGELSDHTSPNEEIEPQFYTKGEMTRLLEQEAFSTRAQLAGYFFTPLPRAAPQGWPHAAWRGAAFPDSQLPELRYSQG